MVCSNSFRSDDAEHNAVGLLHQEMRDLGSLIMRAADQHRVPAGSALAVDREAFAAEVTRADRAAPQHHHRPRARRCPARSSDDHRHRPADRLRLAEAIAAETGEGALAFFDAIAPDRPPRQHRHGRRLDGRADGTRAGKDYINCPLDKEQYDDFVAALIDGEKMPFKDWEKDTPYFEGCMPIEVMAERGPETLRYGPMKGVGLDNPRTGRWPYAVVQLRQDNALGTLWNMVGFQTKLKHGEQVRIFRTIPGLENAEFARLGGIHRNSFINSPQAVGRRTSLEVEAEHPLRRPDHRLRRLCRKRRHRPHRRTLRSCRARRATTCRRRRAETALGALLGHITGGADAETFQPMNVNFGLMPPPPGRLARPTARKPTPTAPAPPSPTGWQRSAIASPPSPRSSSSR